MPGWLEARAALKRCTLDNQWLDVTARCDAGSIPLEVVREYSERNQRMMVDFRINGISGSHS